MSRLGLAISRWALLVLTSPATRQMSMKLGPGAKLDKTILNKYLNLPIPGKTTMTDYIWIDGSGHALRSRTKTLDYHPECVEDLPQWHVDGSQTEQSRDETNSEIRLMPVAMYNDPIRRGGSKLVMCETYAMDYKPIETNTRTHCCEAFSDTKDHCPLFGFCQQYMLMQIDGTPLGWPGEGAELPATGKYFCGVGARNAIGREIVEAHARACLYAGVGLAGFNSDSIPSKWKFETQPTAGIKAPDDIVMARYLLQRIAAEFGVDASFRPDKQNRSGLHVKFTTSFMAEQNGIDTIREAVMALAKKHKAHMKVYAPKKGKGNKKRLGAGYKKFTWGGAGRKLSVRIPYDVERAGCGFLVDRRPAANCDPYAVCSAILRTTLCSGDDSEKKKEKKKKKH